jgi:hypothetical protein
VIEHHIGFLKPQNKSKSGKLWLRSNVDCCGISKLPLVIWLM